MKQVRDFVNTNSIITTVILMIIMIYVQSVAGNIIDQTIISLAGIIGMGMTILSVVVILCAIVIIFSVSGRLVTDNWFHFTTRKATARNELLNAEFEFHTLEQGQQGYMFARPDSNLVGRPVSLETGPFTPLSHSTDTPVSLAKWQHLNAPPQTKNDSVPLLEAGETDQSISWPTKPLLFDMLSDDNGDLNTIILGVDRQNTPIQTSLEEMVHCAFGGETGTGKSTLAYAIAYQIATAPQEAQMILADPSSTTFKTLADCDKLMYPIISKQSELLHALIELHEITIYRTEVLFAPHPTVEKLSEYNAIVNPADRLGYIAVFIDEFPDYLENKEIETILRRLIRKSRKAGIYIFGMGTSWKSTDMDTSIKRQFRTKIHFAASDSTSSRVLLGTNDASELKHVGRAYAKLPFGMSEDNTPVQFQSVFIDKADVVTKLATTSGVETERPLMSEQAVIDAYRNDNGLKECYRIWCKAEGKKIPKSIGGNQTQTIKDILAKWGVF